MQVRTAQAVVPGELPRCVAPCAVFFVHVLRCAMPQFALADDAYTLLQTFLSAPLDDKMQRAFMTERAFQTQRKLLKSGRFTSLDVTPPADWA